VSDLSVRARLYIGGLLATAVVVGVIAVLAALASVGDYGVRTWGTFAALLALAIAAQQFVVRAPVHQTYSLTLAFILAAVLLLPAPLVAGVATLPFGVALVWGNRPSGTRERRPLYVPMFNMAGHCLSALTAQALFVVVIGTGGLDPRSARGMWGILVAVVALVAVNHALVAVALSVVRGVRFRSSGVLTLESLSTDLGLAALGAATAVLAKVNLAISVLSLAPMLLLYRALHVPALRVEARTDPKTGLANAGAFREALEDECHRAVRFRRPVAILMADLDWLRDVNNTYGHLAGDDVLKGVADVIRSSVRQYDVAARFGGEEFAMMLPEADLAVAVEVAERICGKVRSTTFEVATSSTPIGVTVSIGVAAFPEDGREPDELIHRADMALYHAKLSGRDRVCAAANLPGRPIRREPSVSLRGSI